MNENTKAVPTGCNGSSNQLWRIAFVGSPRVLIPNVVKSIDVGSTARAEFIVTACNAYHEQVALIAELQALLEASNRSREAIEKMFPNWTAYRDLAECIEVTLADH